MSLDLHCLQLSTGGENIYPSEIEEWITQHPAVVQVSVVGLPDEKYGEVVAAFIIPTSQTARPINEDIRQWVRNQLGKHKVPLHIWWTGEAGVGDTLPQTASGKVEKHNLRKLGTALLKEQKLRSML